MPEGLPATVTSLLSLTALRLKERNVLIKRTSIIESLGSATIIASDKTGTLTQNRMTVENLWLGGELRAAAAFRPLPEAPAASLERASVLARQSQLARASRALGRVSRVSVRAGAAAAAGGAGAGGPLLATLGELPSVPSAAALSFAERGVSSGSAADVALQRRSSSLGRMSRDPASAMSGLALRPRGDGTFEMLRPPRVSPPSAAAAAAAASSAAAGAPVQPFSVQCFAEGPESVAWDDCSMLTKLVTIATVCNKAKFAPASGDGGGGGSAPPAAASKGSGGAALVAANAPGSAATVAATVAARRTAALPAADAARLADHPDDRPVLGDATDCGLLRYSDRLAPSPLLRAAYKKVFDIPFNSANKFALVACVCAGAPNEHLLLLKGAPEIVVKKCTKYLSQPPAHGAGGAGGGGGVERPIDADFTASMNAAYERCGSLGERVIGFAYARVPARSAADYHADAEALDAAKGAAAKAAAAGDAAAASAALASSPPALHDGRDFVFAGLVSLVDPPRDGVADSVRTCRAAGVRVAMVTGDHPLTAEAIARKVGIVTLATAREVAAEDGLPGGAEDVAADDPRVGAAVVTGQMIRDRGHDEDWWDDVLTKPELVFARTSPQQKLQIVEHLQRLGEVVAVTGDGVNDAPALKRATIGVSMGKGGSDVGACVCVFFRVGTGIKPGARERRAPRFFGAHSRRLPPFPPSDRAPPFQPPFQPPHPPHPFSTSTPQKPQKTTTTTKKTTTARDAADIVLLDDDFCSVVAGIAEGRTVFDNLAKTCAYTLAHAVPEVFPLFLNLALNAPLGLGGLLILSVDLVTEQGPAISLAYEPAEDSIMSRPPRSMATDRLISGPLLRHSYLIVGVAETVACMLSFFAVFWWRGVPLSSVFMSQPTYWAAADPPSPDLRLCPPAAPAAASAPRAGADFSGSLATGADGCRVLTGEEQRDTYFQAQAAWYACLVACQFFHVWTCKTRRAPLFKHGLLRNAVTLYGCGFSLVVMLAIVFVPFLQPVFQTADVPGVAWLPALGFGAWVFAYTEASKRRARRDPDGWWARWVTW